jgi:hypothetical protein
MMSTDDAILRELVDLLAAATSSSNNIRLEAENKLTNEWLSTKPDTLLLGLVEILCQHPEQQVVIHFCQ